MRTTSPGPVDTSGEPAHSDAVLPFVGTRAKVHTSGMVFPQNLSERSWERIGTDLRELVNSSAWWLADWLIYGEATYGWRRYKEAIERTGLDYQTLRNYAWVGRRFEHHRRRDGLSFAHHAEVARLAPPEQDYWLRKAEQRKWSRNELRRTVRASLAAQNDSTGNLTGTGTTTSTGTGNIPGSSSSSGNNNNNGSGSGSGGGRAAQASRPAEAAAARARPGQVTTLTIELSAGELEHYSKAAAAHGLPVGKWVTQVLAATDRLTA